MERKQKPSDRPSDVTGGRTPAFGKMLAVPDFDPDVREFAEQQIYNGVDEEILFDPDQPGRDLDQVQKALYESDINSGSQSFCWCGWRVWLGDPANGIRASASFSPGGDAWESRSAAANWLHEAACRVYPDSDYAKRARREAMP